MKEKLPEIVRKKPKFPRFKHKSDIGNFFDFVFGALIWLVLIIFFFIGLYVNWFSRSLIYLLRLVHFKHYHVPFWFSLVVTIFLFPITLVVILLSVFVKIVRE